MFKMCDKIVHQLTIYCRNRTKKQKTVSSNMGTSSLEEREGRKFAYSGKQMKTWKVMDRQMREYLENIIDSSIKYVSNTYMYI